MNIFPPSVVGKIDAPYTAGTIVTAPHYLNGTRNKIVYGTVKFTYAIDAGGSHSGTFVVNTGLTEITMTSKAEVGNTLNQALTAGQTYWFSFIAVIPANHYFEFVFGTTGAGVTYELMFIHSLDL